MKKIVIYGQTNEWMRERVSRNSDLDNLSQYGYSIPPKYVYQLL